MTRKKCTSCKVELNRTEFKPKRDGTLTKMCIQCLDKATETREKSKCVHGKHHGYCKECHSSQFCEHDRRRTTCKECKGGSICEHAKRRDHCKICSPRSFCVHGTQIAQCTKCGGVSVCKHNRVRSRCKICKGGSVCEHDKIRCVCVLCDGGHICEHKKNRSACNICDPATYLTRQVRHHVWYALKNNKKYSTTDYLGCDIATYRQYIEEQFTDEMSWDNYGVWHIDHITPIKYGDPTIDEVANRLHYTNTQPMWGSDNISKGNRSIG